MKPLQIKGFRRLASSVKRDASNVKRQTSSVKRETEEAGKMDAVPEKTVPDLAPMAVVTLSAMTYSPWKFFEQDPLTYFTNVETRVVSARVPKRLRACGIPGGSLESINDWMTVHGLEVVDVRSRPCFSGRWRGEYVVKIGRKGEREAFLSAFDMAQVEREDGMRETSNVKRGASNVKRETSSVMCAQDW